jgi:hypothetical protein
VTVKHDLCLLAKSMDDVVNLVYLIISQTLGPNPCSLSQHIPFNITEYYVLLLNSCPVRERFINLSIVDSFTKISGCALAKIMISYFPSYKFALWPCIQTKHLSYSLSLLHVFVTMFVWSTRSYEDINFHLICSLWFCWFYVILLPS